MLLPGSPPVEPIRLVVADVHPAVRAGIRCMVDETPSLELVRELDESADYLEVLSDRGVDVLLLGMNLPEDIPVRVTQSLRERESPVRVVAYAASEDIGQAYDMLGLRVAGYLFKSEPESVLLNTLRSAGMGHVGLLGPALLAKLIQDRTSPTRERGGDLSKREREVMRLVAEGVNNKVISERLFISPSTVKNHMTSILSKLEFQSRAEVVAWAWQQGITLPHEGVLRGATRSAGVKIRP